MFSIDPVERSSRTCTWSPPSSSLSQRCEPMKPAPPVIRKRIRAMVFGECEADSLTADGRDYRDPADRPQLQPADVYEEPRELVALVRPGESRLRARQRGDLPAATRLLRAGHRACREPLSRESRTGEPADLPRRRHPPALFALRGLRRRHLATPGDADGLPRCLPACNRRAWIPPCGLRLDHGRPAGVDDRPGGDSAERGPSADRGGQLRLRWAD